LTGPHLKPASATDPLMQITPSLGKVLFHKYGTGGYGKYGLNPYSCGSGIYKLRFTVS
ncbi:hypothetical protein DPMN_010961, partial [Dreissena polymorpha]